MSAVNETFGYTTLLPPGTSWQLDMTAALG